MHACNQGKEVNLGVRSFAVSQKNSKITSRSFAILLTGRPVIDRKVR
jgi:hypothetical protein